MKEKSLEMFELTALQVWYLVEIHLNIIRPVNFLNSIRLVKKVLTNAMRATCNNPG